MILTAALPAAAQDLEHTFALVREGFSGRRALETVAFMEPHWRLPGNPGFDASIRHVAGRLAASGYVPEEEAGPEDRLTYRLERRSMTRPSWEPVDGSLWIVGDEEPLLRFRTNRNMIAINSASTPQDGVVAELVDVGGAGREDLPHVALEGKIAMGQTHVGRLYGVAVQGGGALGVLAYNIPHYNRAEQHPDSIPFSRIPPDPQRHSFGIMLSHRAHRALRQRLTEGPVQVRVQLETRSYPTPTELTLIAEARGAARPDERFVFSAHVQEPGANDNASGVAAQAEMATVLAGLMKTGQVDPARTITFLWGDEISAIARYLREDPRRTQGVRWGMSLDMVGEDTAKTGGTFLIEKMPDPSAVWTRGEDRHSEWGSWPVRLEDLRPHYFNDFVLNRCLEQAAATGWVVKTNPYEGGSDHVPFLRADRPGLLLWHFTDVFYHTDGDRLDMVSPATMKNVGVSALVIALTLGSGDPAVARLVVEETRGAALSRLERERELSRQALRRGDSTLAEEERIIRAWTDWYVGAIRSAVDIELGGPAPPTTRLIEAAAREVAETGAACRELLRTP